MSETHSPASQEEDQTDIQPTQGNTAPDTTQNASPQPTTCSCPTSPQDSETGTDAPQPALISANIDAGTSGITADVDALGKNLADVSIGLGALDSVLGLVDALTCNDASSASTNGAQSAPLIAAAVNADMSGVQAAVDVLGHDTVDASIGLGAIDPVLGLVDSKLALVDSATGLADGLLCDIV